MRKFPKGARWFTIHDGSVSQLLKTNNEKGIKELFFDSMIRHSQGRRYVVVQPRGKLKWYLFYRDWHEEPRLVDTGSDHAPLVMRAILGVH